MVTNKTLLAVGIAAAAAVVISVAGPIAQGPASPTPIGAWFGIARPCTPGGRFPQPLGTDDQPVCQLACQGAACPRSNFPVDEVTMIPTLLADGTVLADDFAELLDFHSTAHGKWEYAGTVVLDGKRVDRYQAVHLVSGPLTRSVRSEEPYVGVPWHRAPPLRHVF